MFFESIHAFRRLMTLNSKGYKTPYSPLLEELQTLSPFATILYFPYGSLSVVDLKKKKTNREVFGTKIT